MSSLLKRSAVSKISSFSFQIQFEFLPGETVPHAGKFRTRYDRRVHIRSSHVGGRKWSSETIFSASRARSRHGSRDACKLKAVRSKYSHRHMQEGLSLSIPSSGFAWLRPVTSPASLLAITPLWAFRCRWAVAASLSFKLRCHREKGRNGALPVEWVED